MWFAVVSTCWWCAAVSTCKKYKEKQVVLRVQPLVHFSIRREKSGEDNRRVINFTCFPSSWPLRNESESKTTETAAVALRSMGYPSKRKWLLLSFAYCFDSTAWKARKGFDCLFFFQLYSFSLLKMSVGLDPCFIIIYVRHAR